MTDVMVQIGECRVATGPEVTLATLALGSCVAVAAFDRRTRVGGLLHILLPDSALDPDKAKRSPGVFADTGLDFLWSQLQTAGAALSRLEIRLAGGASINGAPNYGDIGASNVAAVRRWLASAGAHVVGEQVGGTDPRSVRLDLSTGRFWNCSPGKAPVTIGPESQRSKL